MKFLRAAKSPMTTESIILPQGSHQFTTWRREVVPALQWQSQQLTFPQDTEALPQRKPGVGKGGAPGQRTTPSPAPSASDDNKGRRRVEAERPQQ